LPDTVISLSFSRIFYNGYNEKKLPALESWLMRTPDRKVKYILRRLLFSRSLNIDYNENYERNEMERTWRDKINQAWNDNPLMVIGIGVLAITATAKLIDAVSAAQGRRAYARQIEYKIATRG